MESLRKARMLKRSNTVALVLVCWLHARSSGAQDSREATGLDRCYQLLKAQTNAPGETRPDHYRSVTRCFEQVLETRPDDPEVLVPLADQYRRVGARLRAWITLLKAETVLEPQAEKELRKGIRVLRRKLEQSGSNVVLNGAATDVAIDGEQVPSSLVSQGENPANQGFPLPPGHHMVTWKQGKEPCQTMITVPVVPDATAPNTTVDLAQCTPPRSCADGQECRPREPDCKDCELSCPQGMSCRPDEPVCPPGEACRPPPPPPPPPVSKTGMGLELPVVMTALATGSVVWWAVDGVHAFNAAQDDYDSAVETGDAEAIGEAHVSLKQAELKRNRLAWTASLLSIGAGLSWGAYAIWRREDKPAPAEPAPPATSSARLRVHLQPGGVSLSGSF